MNKKVLSFCSVAVLAVAGVVYWMNKTGDGVTGKPAETNVGQQDSGDSNSNNSGGGSVAKKPGKDPDYDPELGDDRVKFLKPNANKTTKDLVSKKKAGKLTHRNVSVVCSEKLPPFDKAIMSDPQKYQKYLDEHVPSRVHQVIDTPGPGIPVLKSRGGRYYEVLKGDSVTLKVKTVPNGPVTFMSPHLGTFSNELTSITVKADNSGIATAEFTASGGSSWDCEVLAGSPLAVGQVKFTIHIKPGKVSN